MLQKDINKFTTNIMKNVTDFTSKIKDKIKGILYTV